MEYFFYEFNLLHLLWLIPLGLYLLITLKSWFYIVGGKEMAILQTLGKPHEKGYGPGLHFKLPWPFTSIYDTLSTQISQLEAKVSIKTKDNVFMTLPIKVQFRVDDDPFQAVLAAYELEDPEEQVEAYVLNSIRSTAASMNMKEIFENRDQIQKNALDDLEQRFRKFGYIIENVLLDQPLPPKEVQDSFNQVIASERLKEAAQHQAEAIRVKKVGEAQADAESKKLQGEGMAAMRKAIAEGLTEATEIIVKAGLTPAEATAFLTDINRLDSLVNVGAHGNVMILDIGKGSIFSETMAGIQAGNLRPKKKTV